MSGTPPSAYPIVPAPAGRAVRPPIWLDPIVGWALLFAIITRICLAIAAWFSLRVFDRFPFYDGQRPDSFFPNNPGLDGWVRWDSAHMIELARAGYGAGNTSPGEGWGFFPLYSMLMRGLVEITFLPVTERNLALAGLVIANLSFIALIALLARWSADLFGDQAARMTVLLFCLSPFSYFFNAAYTESLFVLLVIATLMLASSNRWFAAGAVAGLATATRLVGLALIPALLYLAWKRKISLIETVTCIVLSSYGVLAFGVYSAFRTGNPFQYFEAQANWGDWGDHVGDYIRLFVTQPREALGGDPRHLVIMLNVFLLIVALAWLPAVWRRLDPATAVYTTLIVVMQGAMTWVSLGRYLLPAIGVYLVAGRWLAQSNRSPWTRDTVVAVGTIALTTLLILFAHGFWAI
ncbi:MAG: DUF2029 domain-containing protein [Thermomicrobiales bacterium]|nr:DUF2029 domain-containing protein [Thermomicrobiales bacterium]